MVGIGHLAATAMNVCEGTDGRQILGGAAQHLLELGGRLVVVTDLDECAPERDAGGNVRGVALQPRAAGLDGLGNMPRRRYSSASAAKEIDAGSRWTRRFSSSSRGVSVMTAIGVYG